MIAIDKKMEAQQLKSKMILQVHDELVFDTLLSEEQQLKEIVEKEMREALELQVPVVVDMNTGANWLIAH